MTQENKEMLNSNTIALMHNGAMIVNTARGKLINEQALYDALVSGKLRGAALDVHYEEPLQQDATLKNLENVILTPHIAGLSYETFHAMMEGAVNNIASFEKNDVDIIKDKKLI